MSSMNVTFAGDTTKYKAELWNNSLDTKIADIPLNVPYVVNGDYSYILFSPIMAGIEFDSYTDDAELIAPWDYSAPTIEKIDVMGNPFPDGIVGMYLSDESVSNVANSPTYTLNYVGEVITITPFNRLHLMNSEALTSFSNIALITKDANGNEVFNYSVYIANLLNIGFELPSQAIAGNSNIILGNFDTGVNTPIFNNDSVSVDLGNIHVPSSNSSLDYLSNKFELFLPFVESPIEIEPSLCVGKTIRVEYIIDLYTGDVTINLYNGDATPFASSKATIGRNIPTKLVGETNYSVSGTNGVINNVLTPYIRHTKPEIVESQFYNLVTKNGSIGIYKGYIEVDNMELQGKALLDEKHQILSLLRNGVIVK